MSAPNTETRLSRRALLASTLGVFAASFAVDQLTKLWALSALADGTEFVLLPSVSFRLAFNPGVAFSLGAEYGAVTGFFVLILLTALSVWIAWKIVRRHRLTELAILGLVAGGGWGNMYDRITRGNDGLLTGHVVDMIAVDWFAIFNFGDVLVVCGMVAWIAHSLFGSGESHRSAR
ncbi:signal peptidase II [Mycetocola manganoxydans]|uniref:Lipoprotein signal peptidase n=1 Tax=Mycetocola manganoxydans TaxID=699879 RepID=A0A3L6ZKK0_9MICO|nr:signal peptidase II [Mycetocola manganoxydans]RLP68524.1 signal peptidase II [Mycetocola manganoxydans]GHD51964.1 lipoprotein signal peptidase [Mycetocola manganoxydans]